MNQLVFGWTDYLLFGSLLGVSLLIGIYFGFFSKQDSVNEYLFGGKRMGYFPVAVSILSSLLSGITFLGVPTETYLHGGQYGLTVLNTIATGLFTAYVFMPVFYKLQITSTFEYLELRFSKQARKFASFLYVLSLMIYVPIVIYVPALACSQVTGYNLHAITPILCIICITYTTMGGVKAVIWTDTIQFIFAIGGLVAILILGVSSVGGFLNIWKIADEGERLDIFDLNPSPFVRNTFWAMTVGTLFSSLSHSAIGQKFIQRFMSIGSQEDINKAVLIKTIGTVTVDIAATFTGLIIYARYHGCDPVSAKLVERGDQVMPYFVMDITKHIPGVSGVFLAGIVSSALSAMSASVNTLSGIIYEDFIDQWITEGPEKDAMAAKLMKIITVIIGLISIALIFIIEHMGTVLEISYGIRGAVDGPLLGFFILGMFFPSAGKKGAIVGGSISLLIMLWISIGAKWHIMNHRIRYSNLPMSIENCSYPLNETIVENVTVSTQDPANEPMILFKITFLYFVLLGSSITVIIGIITSYVVKESDASKIDPDLVAPFLRRFLPKKNYTEVPLREISKEKIISS